jgi:hypothetical protein
VAADILGRMDHAIGMAPVLIPEVATGGQGTTAGAVRVVLVSAGSLKVSSKRTRAARACASPILSRAVSLLVSRCAPTYGGGKQAAVSGNVKY